ncbi:MAG: nucleoside hydrolase [Fimbriimonadaceae bacterium]|nr:nucleoside hydrolase [Fimbriimonadaceae bacterium]
MSEQLAVIFDTDIGSDIDDAVALAYLLSQPRCELLGITCASGSQRDRARLASAVCTAAGRPEVPIHCGPEPSLLRGVRQPHAPQAAVLERWPHRADFPPATAVEWLRQTIRARPGEVWLLSVGPLTNIGLLFASDPEIPSLLAGYALMGGRFLPGEAPGGHTEWNIMCDPEAAAIAFNRGPAGTLAVGLDVTLRCQLEAAEVRRRFAAAGGPLAAVLAMAEVWFAERPVITFHDPLAAACLFAPQLCTWRHGTVRVDLRSDLVPALTHFAAAPDGRHQVAATVDSAAFFDHYFGVTGG